MKYTRMGIYDRNDIILTRENEGVFVESTEYIALIKCIHGESLGSIGQGTKVYRRRDVDCDIMNIFTTEAWRAIYENDLINAEIACYKWPINWLADRNRDVPCEVLEYVKNHFPGETTDLLPFAGTLQIAKWLYENGAVLEPEGYKYSAKEWWLMRPDKNHIEMYEYFFGENGICK